MAGGMKTLIEQPELLERMGRTAREVFTTKPVECLG